MIVVTILISSTRMYYINLTSLRTNLWNFRKKKIENWRFWKTQFFWVGHFGLAFLCFCPFWALCRTAWPPYRLSHIIQCPSYQFILCTQGLIHEIFAKNIENWRSWKMSFFLVGHFFLFFNENNLGFIGCRVIWTYLGTFFKALVRTDILQQYFQRKSAINAFADYK